MFVSELIPISVHTISPEATIGVDLYCQVDHSDRAQLFRGGNYPINPEDLNKLKSRGVKQLFIESGHREEYQAYLRDVAGDTNSSSSQQASALNEVVLDVLESNFKTKDTDNTVDAASELGCMAANLVSREDFAAHDLLKVLNHDYATFTHSANVAFYCGMLAKGLQLDREEIELIVAGGLLHDLGKLEIKDSILTKPGRLDETEFAQIQQHPLTGFRQLAPRSDLTHGQLMMVYQHHEKLMGGGYPVGIQGDEIHPWAKLCAVVDIYEAVTSHRPYRTPMPRDQAFDLLRRESGTGLDPEMVECWISIIQPTTRS